jgi:hypothetical protein
MKISRTKTIIDNSLVAFESNPYGDFQTEGCTPCVKTVIPTNQIILSRDIDVIYGIRHQHGQPLICMLECSGIRFHTFLIEPDEITWVLNGTPVFMCCLNYHNVKLHFRTEDNDDDVYETLDLYGVMLDADILTLLYSQGVFQCVFSDYNCFRYAGGMGGIAYTEVDVDVPRTIKELTNDNFGEVYIYRNPIYMPIVLK